MTEISARDGTNTSRTAVLLASLYLVLAVTNISYGSQQLSGEDVVKLIRPNNVVNSIEVESLKNTLENDPENLTARIKLISFYMWLKTRDKKYESDHAKSTLWFIRNVPGQDWMDSPVFQPHFYFSPKEFELGRVIWEEHVTQNPKNAQIIGNAANFLVNADNEYALKLYQRCQIIEPRNSNWPKRIGHIFGLLSHPSSPKEFRKLQQKSLKAYERAYELENRAQGEYSILTEMALAAFESGETDKAREYAQQLLISIESVTGTSRSGRRIFWGNYVLGLVAHESGNLVEAGKYLISAGKTTGSPGLNSFGPHFGLAKKLLSAGQSETVVRYINLCKRFWKGNKDFARLDSWIADIRAGKEPKWSMYVRQ